MDDMFSVDTKALRKYSKMMKIKRKAEVFQIERAVLNSQAFAVRSAAIRKGGTIDQALTVRGKGKNPWSKSGVLVDMARGRDMQSEVGSKWKWKKNDKQKFYGLRDAELGASWKQNGITSDIARVSGLNSKVFSPKTRKKLQNPTVITGSDTYNQISQISGLEVKKPKEFFRVKKKTKALSKGVYKFGTRKVKWKNGTKHRPIIMVRNEKPQRVKQSRTPWLKPAMNRAITKRHVMAMYRKAYKTVISRRK